MIMTEGNFNYIFAAIRHCIDGVGAIGYPPMGPENVLDEITECDEELLILAGQVISEESKL